MRAYTVGGGSGTYAMPSSSNQSVASVNLVGSTLTVNGLTGGNATITVRDSLNATITINVIVGSGSALFTAAPSAITMAPGATPSYEIGGGAPIATVGALPYVTSSSNNSVVTSLVSVVGTTPTLRLTGIAAGTAVVNVLDSTGSLVAINVTVGSGGGGSSALFTTAPSPLTVGTGAVATYLVSGGTGPYSANSSNPAVATSSVSVGTLTINSVANGLANIVVTDSVGARLTIEITVTATATTPLVVTPSTVTANVGDVLNFTVSGASPAYSIAVNNTSVATASSAAVSTSGGAFTITLRNVGTTTVAITDSLGQTTTLALTVNATATTLRLSPSAITVGEGQTPPPPVQSVVLNIYGGTGPYTAFTDDLVLSGVSIVGNVFTVGVGTKGNRCIDSIDRTDPAAPVYTPYGTVPVTLTVVDSLGASATSVMTIRDNGVSSGGGC